MQFCRSHRDMSVLCSGQNRSCQQMMLRSFNRPQMPKVGLFPSQLSTSSDKFAGYATVGTVFQRKVADVASNFQRSLISYLTISSAYSGTHKNNPIVMRQINLICQS